MGSGGRCAIRPGSGTIPLHRKGGFIPTHYQILGLARDASSTDVAQAFREKLAEAQGQPDAAERVEAIRYAYQVLASPTARAQYDAELPPDPRERRERERRERGPLDPLRVLRDSWVAKTLALAVIFVLALAIYRTSARPAPAPPPPPVRSAAAPANAEPSAEERAVAAARMERQKQVAVARPMTPEEIFAAASRSVVGILASDDAGAYQGSGVVIAQGAVVTSCHVLHSSQRATVRVGDRQYEGTIRVADYELDLCSLSVRGLSAPAALPGFEAKVGQRVYAIGAPQGLDLTLSEGLVSALRETSHGAIIQTSAAVSPGSSGGGLFNASGELVGIVAFQAKNGQNLHFALPAAWILEMTDRASSLGLSPAR